MGFIYKITNKENGKIYIGKTVNTIQERWHEHIDEAFGNNASNSLLHKAIAKYGVSSFLVEEVGEFLDSELNEKEIFYIKEYKSFHLDGGYNLTYGGEGTTRYSDEEILRLWNKGYLAGEIAKKIGARSNTVSQRLKFLVEAGEPRRRFAETRKKAVVQYSLDGEPIKIWDCACNAEKEVGLSAGQVSKCCNYKAVMAGGYLWKFLSDDTPIIQLQERYAASPLCKEVHLLDDDGNVVKKYNNGREAELELGLGRGLVSSVCNKVRKHTRNYKFEWGNPIKRRLINEKFIRSTEEDC